MPRMSRNTFHKTRKRFIRPKIIKKVSQWPKFRSSYMKSMALRKTEISQILHRSTNRPTAISAHNENESPLPLTDPRDAVPQAHLPRFTQMLTVSVINWWPTTGTILSHSPSTYVDTSWDDGHDNSYDWGSPKFKWFTWHNHAPFSDGPCHPWASTDRRTDTRRQHIPR